MRALLADDSATVIKLKLHYPAGCVSPLCAADNEQCHGYIVHLNRARSLPPSPPLLLVPPSAGKAGITRSNFVFNIAP